MEPAETPVRTVFVFQFEVYEANEGSFSVGGNRYYVHDHGLATGDMVTVTIRKRTINVHPDNNNKG